MEGALKSISTSLAALKANTTKPAQNRKRCAGLYKRFMEAKALVETEYWQEKIAGDYVEFLNKFNAAIKNASRVALKYRVQKNMHKWGELVCVQDEILQVHNELKELFSIYGASKSECDYIGYTQEKMDDLNEMEVMLHNVLRSPARLTALHTNYEEINRGLHMVNVQKGMSVSTIQTEDIEILHHISNSQEKDVFKALWRNSAVCIYKYDRSRVDCYDACLSQLLKDLPVYQRIRHPNIDDFYGIRTEENQVHVVLEYVREGQLYEKLRRLFEIGELSIQPLLSYSLDIVEGALHLQTTAPSVSCDDISLEKVYLVNG